MRLDEARQASKNNKASISMIKKRKHKQMAAAAEIEEIKQTTATVGDDFDLPKKRAKVQEPASQLGVSDNL